MNEIGTVERAFQLARSGQCRNVDDIRQQLRREHGSQIDEHLAGSSIRKQLVREMALLVEPRTGSGSA